MNKKGSSNWPVRLLFLCLVSVSLLISAPQREARAVDDSCTTMLGFCYFNCANAHPNNVAAYQACAAGCEMNYSFCSSCAFSGLPPDCDGEYDFPEPFPVVADYLQCMNTCAACKFLPLNEFGACWRPCKAHCIATYAQ